MTGKEILAEWECEDYRCNSIALNSRTLIARIDAALAAERERCAQVVWEHRGCCVNDESAHALMEEVRRTP